MFVNLDGHEKSRHRNFTLSGVAVSTAASHTPTRTAMPHSSTQHMHVPAFPRGRGPTRAPGAGSAVSLRPAGGGWAGLAAAAMERRRSLPLAPTASQPAVLSAFRWAGSVASWKMEILLVGTSPCHTGFRLSSAVLSSSGSAVLTASTIWAVRDYGVFHHASTTRGGPVSREHTLLHLNIPEDRRRVRDLLTI